MKKQNLLKNLVRKFIPREESLPGSKAAETSIRSYICSKISEMRTGKLFFRGHPYAENSILNWNKLNNLWGEFERHLGRQSITFEEMDFEIYYDFLSFCDGKGYAEGTKFLYASLLKSAMNYAEEEHVSSNRIQRDKRFVAHRRAETTNVFLTTREIEKIAALDLCGNTKLEEIRDVFLVGCYTGQRFSDYSKLTDSNLILLKNRKTAHKAFKIKQKKTGKTVIIPDLNDRIYHLLQKRGGRLPDVSLREMNKSIKEICSLAGIRKEVVLIKNRGGERILKTAPKYQFVSSHTARRSCLTNLYLSGKLNLGQIRSISGHSTEESLSNYLCQSKEEQAIQVLRALQKA